MSMDARKQRMALLVADGLTIAQAGEAMGLTKGQTSRVWNNIKTGLGRQAR